MRKYFRFAFIEGDGAHRVARVLHALEAFEDFVSTFDHLACHVALVGHADVGGGVTADQAVVADEPELCPAPNYVPRSFQSVEQTRHAVDIVGGISTWSTRGIMSQIPLISCCTLPCSIQANSNSMAPGSLSS